MVFAVLIVRLPIMPAFAVFVPPIAFLIAVPSNHLMPVFPLRSNSHQDHKNE